MAAVIVSLLLSSSRGMRRDNTFGKLWASSGINVLLCWFCYVIVMTQPLSSRGWKGNPNGWSQAARGKRKNPRLKRGPANSCYIKRKQSSEHGACQVKSLRLGFPGHPGVETLPSIAGGAGSISGQSAGSIPGRRAKIPPASWPKPQKYKTEAIL